MSTTQPNSGSTAPEQNIVRQVARQQRTQLALRYRRLRQAASERSERDAPMYTSTETNAEADGVARGLEAVEEIIEALDAVESGRPE